MAKYSGATKRIRVSCAYLFRIVIQGKYLLTIDEQGKNVYQAVGGAYKYNDDLNIKERFMAVPCNQYKYTKDLDRDLRLLINRNKLRRFKHWYHSQKNRENINNLYREFYEELIEDNVIKEGDVFETIHYRFCGEHIETSRYIDTIQIHFADIVELLPTKEQEKVFLQLMENPPSRIRFATEDEILKGGIACGSEQQVATISKNADKILECCEYKLKKRSKRATSKIYTASCPKNVEIETFEEILSQIKPGDTSKDFLIVSYQSANILFVLDNCLALQKRGLNIVFDRNKVCNNWKPDLLDEFKNPNCKGAIVFVDKNYLNSSTACLCEVETMNDARLPHFVFLLELTPQSVNKTIQFWVKTDDADKNKLCSFKKFFDYDDNTGHVNNTCIVAKDDMSHLENPDFVRYVEHIL